ERHSHTGTPLAPNAQSFVQSNTPQIVALSAGLDELKSFLVTEFESLNFRFDDETLKWDESVQSTVELLEDAVRRLDVSDEQTSQSAAAIERLSEICSTMETRLEDMAGVLEHTANSCAAEFSSLRSSLSAIEQTLTGVTRRLQMLEDSSSASSRRLQVLEDLRSHVEIPAPTGTSPIHHPPTPAAGPPEPKRQKHNPTPGAGSSRIPRHNRGQGRAPVDGPQPASQSAMAPPVIQPTPVAAATRGLYAPSQPQGLAVGGPSMPVNPVHRDGGQGHPPSLARLHLVARPHGPTAQDLPHAMISVLRRLYPHLGIPDNVIASVRVFGNSKCNVDLADCDSISAAEMASAMITQSKEGGAMYNALMTATKGLGTPHLATGDANFTY
ncbi:hypothetical protein DL93DRAFT_2172497, partial [Clavulina sp. PMI_390]